MRLFERTIIAVLAPLLVFASCGGRGGGSSEPELRKETELLRAVPSDAAAAFCFGTCSDGLALMADSGDALRASVPSRLENAPAVIAWCYNGSIVPLLALSAPKDTNAAVREALELAAGNSISASYLPGVKSLSGRGVLLMSRSESVTQSAKRHLLSGASILDAKGFPEALATAPDSDALLFFSNAAAAKWLRKDCLNDRFSRPDICEFIREAAEWTVVSLDSDSDSGRSATVVTSRPAGDSWFCNLLSSQTPSDSRLAPVLPQGTTFALTMPIADKTAFRAAYERYLDATVKLTKYQNASAALKKTYSQSPQDWETEQDFKEVARVCWDGREVLLVRPAKSGVAFKTRQNRRPGYLGVLYGKAFALKDESSVANIGRWLVIGSRADVDAFAEVRERLNASEWTSKPSRYILYNRDEDRASILRDTRQETKLTVYNLNNYE